MDKNISKHLVVALGGMGLCIAGPQVYSWFIVTGNTIIAAPFQIIGVLLVIIGVLCCIGAMLCQLDRYKKK